MVKEQKEVKRMIASNLGNNENCDPENLQCQNRECDCDGNVYHDEMRNLNKHLEGRVVTIAKLGLWNGSRQGYRVLNYNLNSIFQVTEDYNEFFSDGKNIRAINIHHDGRNKMLFRELRPDRSEESIEKFLTEIYNGAELTPQKLAAYTRSLHPYVAKIYGW